MTTAEKVDKINSLRKEGKTVEEACKEVKLSNPTYYAFTKKNKLTRKYTRRNTAIPSMFSVNIPTMGDRVIFFMGSSEDIAKLSSIVGGK